MKKWSAVYGLLFLPFVAASCKPIKPGSSGAKDLNVVFGDDAAGRRRFTCGPSPEKYEAVKAKLGAGNCADKVQIVGSDSGKNDLKRALLAVPGGLCEYFVKSQGVIELVGGAADECAGKVKEFLSEQKTDLEAKLAASGTSDKERDAIKERLKWVQQEMDLAGKKYRGLHSCWYRQKDHPPTVLVEADAKTNSSEIIPAFMYFLLETFTEDNLNLVRAKSGLTPGQFSEQITAAKTLARYRLALANRMTDDLENADKLAQIDLYNQYFVTPSVLTLPGSVSFGNFVFAEAADSFFCSAESHAEFAREDGPFANTYGAFRWMLAANELSELWQLPWHFTN